MKYSSRDARWPLLCGAVLVGFTALQSIPLPAGLVSTLASTNADVWARALTPLREAGPALHPITVAPIATHVEIVRGILYVSVFLTALGIALEHGGTRFLEIVVVVSGVLLALVTLGHSAVHADRVFGFYRPHDAQGFVAGRLGPILNPNHFAAYSNVGACVAAGVALDERRLVPRMLMGSAALLLAGASVWAGSRGGTGALVCGAFAVIGLKAFRKRSREATRRADVAVVALAIAAAAVFLGVGFSDVARADLGQQDVSKVALVKQAFRLVPLTPVFGIGRGAFETMFPFVRDGSTYFTFIRAENIVAQWCIEWGIPITVVAFAMLGWALRPTSVLRAQRPPIGPWCAVAVTVLHELVDFHLEVPAIVLLVAVCAAICLGARNPGVERASTSKGHASLRRAAFATLPLALVASVVVLGEAGHSLADDRDALAKAAVDPSVAPDAFRDELRGAILRHPAEPFFPLAGAIHAQRMGANPTAFVGRALERYPRFGRAHLVLARSLAARGRAQARLEYRLAYENDAVLRPVVLREAPALVDGEFAALDLVPDGASGDAVLEAVIEAIADRLPSTAARLDRRLLERDPSSVGPLRRRVKASISDLVNGFAWCNAGGECSAAGMQAAEALVQRTPDRCEAHVLLAQMEIAAGHPDAALDRLAESKERVIDRAACFRTLVGLALELGDKRRANEALDSALRSGCGSRDECLDLYVWAAATEARRGNQVRAVSFYERAAELQPEHDEYMIAAAELAEQAGLSGEAIDVYEKLALRHPEDARWRTHARELRTKSLGRNVPGRFAPP